jgi:hypothetical protein
MAQRDGAATKTDFSLIQHRNLLLFWQAFLEARVLNFASGIFHCGSAAPCPLWL